MFAFLWALPDEYSLIRHKLQRERKKNLSINSMQTFGYSLIFKGVENRHSQRRQISPFVRLENDKRGGKPKKERMGGTSESGSRRGQVFNSG